MRTSVLSSLTTAVVASLVVTASSVTAGPPSNELLKQFSGPATRLLADPVRPRVYATLRSQNSVLVINTETLTAQTISIGSAPSGLAISADGSKLYVANSGSTTRGVGVLDLNTLEALPAISTPAQPTDVAAGKDGVIYITPGPTRIDTNTGTATNFGGSSFSSPSLLQISPDRNILYTAERGGGTLRSYDVSTPAPQLLQTRGNHGSNCNDLALSHDGSLLASPCGGGNTGSGYGTTIIPASNFNAVIGTLPIGAYPGPITFSPDDQTAYEIAFSQNVVKVYDLKTFTQTGTVNVGSNSSYVDFTDVTTDRSGTLLFVSSADFRSDQSTGFVNVYSIAPTPNAAYPLNISTRLRVESGVNSMIAGFIIRGGNNKKLLIRALGPSLQAAGVSGAMADPSLSVRDSNGQTRAWSSDWVYDHSASQIRETGLQPSHDRESATIATLAPGSYTAIVEPNTGGGGVGLVELYDLDPQPSGTQLANISTRGRVLTGDDVLIGGFIVAGNGQFGTSVVVRALGPSLAQAGVSGALADPTLELYDSNGTQRGANDNWKDSQQNQLQTVGLNPTADSESALLADLAPGAYTAVIRGRDDTTGVALVEVYNLGP